MKNSVPPIEPRILPLVTEINNTTLFETFSSCQGHFEKDDRELMDRSHTDVRSDIKEGMSLEKTEHFLTHLITEFKRKHRFSPISLIAYKLYTPSERFESNYIFVIEFVPFDRFDEPSKKEKA